MRQTVHPMQSTDRRSKLNKNHLNRCSLVVSGVEIQPSDNKFRRPVRTLGIVTQCKKA